MSKSLDNLSDGGVGHGASLCDYMYSDGGVGHGGFLADYSEGGVGHGGSVADYSDGGKSNSKVRLQGGKVYKTKPVKTNAVIYLEREVCW